MKLVWFSVHCWFIVMFCLNFQLNPDQRTCTGFWALWKQIQISMSGICIQDTCFDYNKKSIVSFWWAQALSNLNWPLNLYRHYALRQLVLNPPFRRMETSALHTEGLVERLWKMMKWIISVFNKCFLWLLLWKISLPKHDLQVVIYHAMQ